MKALNNVDWPSVWSTKPSHPGESLSVAMKNRGMGPNDIAEMTGFSPQRIGEIVGGTKPISPDFAIALGTVFDGIPSQFWANRQTLYDAAILRNEENERLYKPQIRVFKRHFPNDVYNDLVDQEYVQWEAPDAERVRSLCEMFGSESLEESCESQPKRRFRDSPVKTDAKGALTAWLWKGEKLAEQRAQHMRQKFNREKLSQAARTLRCATNSTQDEFLAVIANQLAAAGVIFVALPHIKRCGVRGASWRLESGHYAIQVNDHGKKADRFWFTLFHEIGHVYNGDESSLDADSDDDAIQHHDAREEAADRFALDMLIPPDEWRSFVHDNKLTYTHITRFADQSGVHPGIVAGRLATLRHIEWADAAQFTSPFDLNNSLARHPLIRYVEPGGTPTP